MALKHIINPFTGQKTDFLDWFKILVDDCGMSWWFVLVRFFYGFGVLVKVGDLFGFFEGFDGFFLSFHDGKIGAFAELKHARFSAHKVLICCLHGDFSIKINY